MTNYTSIITALRTKTSRDNRKLANRFTVRVDDEMFEYINSECERQCISVQEFFNVLLKHCYDEGV